MKATITLETFVFKDLEQRNLEDINQRLSVPTVDDLFSLDMDRVLEFRLDNTSKPGALPELWARSIDNYTKKLCEFKPHEWQKDVRAYDTRILGNMTMTPWLYKKRISTPDESWLVNSNQLICAVEAMTKLYTET